jgi:cyclopropane-fatty-acyl-phospholipid synthase
MPDRLDDLLASAAPPAAIAIEMPAPRNQRILIGKGEPALTVYVRNERGERAVRSLEELEICEAFIRGDLDFDGDLSTAASLHRVLSDSQWWIKTWRRVKPILIGRRRVNPEWIALHYDSENVQLIATDRDWHVYTPGIYDADDDSLETGACRKLENAFTMLRLGPGKTLLEVGCGWGGFTRYCAQRRVKVTGITLSRHQLEYSKALIAQEGLSADLMYQDFFDYDPGEQYDAVSAMGVIEDLSDYQRVMRCLAKLVKPGGRVFLDFATSKERFGTASFITKYIWPGTFRMVYLPELMDAISQSVFELMDMRNDRHNYYLWARENYRRWIEHKAEVVAKKGEALWRTFHLMHAGTTAVMRDAESGVSAYRMVLQRRLA